MISISPFVSVLAVIAIGYLVDAQNFCDPSLCPPGVTNTGCQNTGTFSSACPSSTGMLPMTSSLKGTILHWHNALRNYLAAGGYTRFSTASRMGTVQWDSTLELMASYAAKTCLFQHDACRNTPQFLYAGQNLGKTWWYGQKTDLELATSLMNQWWTEISSTTMAEINSYPTSTSSMIGHFTQMANDKSIYIGCAGAAFPENGMNSLTLVCNYARTNIFGKSTYTVGPTASGCTTGTNPNYPSLCSISEPIDPNQL